MVRSHVLEGVFCEPQYGGNKGMVGWRMVNFPGQQYGYADAYINRPVDLPLDKDTVEKP
jgi:gluconate 2-dehydrogenase gamma chain